MQRPLRLASIAALSAMTAMIAVIAGARSSSAQTLVPGYAMNRYEPAEHGAHWFVADSLDLRGELRPSLGAVIDFAWHPQVFHDVGTTTPLVHHQTFLHLGGGLVFLDRFRFALELPVVVDESGNDERTGDQLYLGPARSSDVGDLRLSFDAMLHGKFGDAFRVGAGARMWAPTGHKDTYTSDGKPRFAPHVTIAGDVREIPISWSLTTEFVVRPHRDEAFADTPIGSGFVVRGAIGARLLDEHLLVGPELLTWFDTTGGPGSHRVAPELMMGGHLEVGQVRAGIGIGTGIGGASGTATVRMLASIEWLIEPRSPKPVDVDVDSSDAIDVADKCPPPDRVTSEDVADGCPIRDGDGDGVADGLDACPSVPGVKHLDPHKNGCPRDRDGDGVIDDQDACLNVPGAPSSDPAKNGCPPDHDGDGVPDKDDACPDEPGVADPDPAKNGCPPPVVIQSGQLKISAQLKFESNSSKVLVESHWILEAVAQTMKEHPEIKKLRIEGHTDNVGYAEGNKMLSAHRAAEVLNELVNLGVEKSRMHSVGLGSTKPIADNTTEEGRKANRRVEFHIEE
jgi:outer membrane protein OmpA-like peptidoglycan-associated protein